jgi:hypothetical protein
VAKKRVIAVVNKWWECDPVLNVLLHDNARPAATLGWPNPLNHPRPRPDQNNLPPENPSPVPRAVFNLKNTTIEIWCISDLLEHFPDQAKFQSSSELKARYLPRIFAGQAADFVVAVGTAGYPGINSENGSVTVGTKIFVHNGHPNGENPDSNWTDGPFDTILNSSLTETAFDQVTTIETSPKPSVMDRFMVPPLNPASYGKLIARFDYAALATVNVTNYAEYAERDAETQTAFTNSYNIFLARSLETTHCLIRKQSEAPFIFVSGITDRVGHFDDEVSSRPYAQNTSAAHNAGIVLAWMLPGIDSCLA